MSRLHLHVEGTGNKLFNNFLKKNIFSYLNVRRISNVATVSARRTVLASTIDISLRLHTERT